MDRRELLKLANGAIATACGAIVGIPGVRYIIATVSRHESATETTQRVIRLKDLPVGRPTLIAVTGQRRDAWTVYADEIIGRVWLLKTPDPQQKNQTAVTAYSAICPHLGCTVSLDGATKRFVCPCHKAAWELSGKKLADRKLGHKNPSPRDMDKMTCAVVVDDETGEPWVELTYQRFKKGLTTQVLES